MLFRYHNNEDAGDLQAFIEQDYYAEVATERAALQQRIYREQFDRDTQPGYLPVRPVTFHVGTQYETVTYQTDRYAGRLPGPCEPPVCEECLGTLARDSDAQYDERDGVFLHNECAESYHNSYVNIHEPREFPTYG